MRNGLSESHEPYRADVLSDTRDGKQAVPNYSAREHSIIGDTKTIMKRTHSYDTAV